MSWQQEIFGDDLPTPEELIELTRCECGSLFEDTIEKLCSCNRSGCVNFHCIGCDKVRYGFGPAGCPL